MGPPPTPMNRDAAHTRSGLRGHAGACGRPWTHTAHHLVPPAHPDAMQASGHPRGVNDERHTNLAAARKMASRLPHSKQQLCMTRKYSPPPREMGVMMPLTTTSRSAPGRLTPCANEPNARALRRTAVGKAAERGSAGGW